jgi:arsenite methyltransferase
MTSIEWRWTSGTRLAQQSSRTNGVINLAPRKSRVLAECARVLRPGGRLTVSDLTVDDEELPPEILTHPATWAG